MKLEDNRSFDGLGAKQSTDCETGSSVSSFNQSSAWGAKLERVLKVENISTHTFPKGVRRSLANRSIFWRLSVLLGDWFHF
jgi:hypothetical protein